MTSASVPLSRDERTELVASIAQLVEAHYVFADRASDIAFALRATPPSLANGDPDALVRDLTGWLRAYDGHFAVTREATPTAAPPKRISWTNEAQRRVNYGFQQVRILPGAVAAVTVTLFADLEPADAPAAQARSTADAAMTLCSNATAVIFDLRGNGGGSPAMVAHLLARFVPEPVHIITFVGRDGARHEDWTPALPSGVQPLDIPVYVVVDDGTASAAESFAYALQSLGRAMVVGRPTVGIANPVEIFPSVHGFTVSVPVGAPIDPRTQTNWDGSGVTPDVLTTSSNALRRAHDLALS